MSKPEKKKKNLLGKITIEEQFQMSMISLGGMMIILVATAIYLVGWIAESWVFKTLIILNAIFGVMFLTSMLATSYQQYQMYKSAKQGMDAVQGLGDLFGGLDEKEDAEDEENQLSINEDYIKELKGGKA